MRWVKRLVIGLGISLFVFVVIEWRLFRDRAPVQDRQAGPREAEKRILIATQDYSFRAAIIDKNTT